MTTPEALAGVLRSIMWGVGAGFLAAGLLMRRARFVYWRAEVLTGAAILTTLAWTQLTLR